MGSLIHADQALCQNNLYCGFPENNPAAIIRKKNTDVLQGNGLEAGKEEWSTIDDPAILCPQLNGALPEGFFKYKSLAVDQYLYNHALDV